MQNFNTEKKGYNKDEVQKTIETLVEDYESKLLQQRNRINELKQELIEVKEQLVSYKSQDKNISGALIAAVETAQEIEKNSKNIYELEIKKLRLLYHKWENFLNEMLLNYPDMRENFNPEAILIGFKEAIDRTIEENFTSMRNQKKENNKKAREGIHSLLNKMTQTAMNKQSAPKPLKESNNNYYKKSDSIIRASNLKKETIELTKAKNDLLKEQMRLANTKSNIKPITNLTLSNEDEYDNLVDKYLTVNNVESEEFLNNAYAKQLTKKKKKSNNYPEPNETGFDLKQALNPTEELSEIMKAFDFFDTDED
ncbi:MAG: DivIVA domain-containing protein [Bacteroidales bacterium]|nr:DivIVA domain-containing protein [Bacteroidales bacterium]